MVNFCDLPTEIWLLIAENLTEFELFKLKLVNSFFFNCWFDHKWKDVEVCIGEAPAPPRTVRLLMRVADPFIAVRTKSLSLHFNLGGRTSNIYFDTARTVLPLLPNLTFLKITLFRIPASDAASFRTITSSSVAKRLRKLSLSGDVKTISSLGEYSVHSTPFENLTELILELSLDDKSSTRTEPCLTLEPFLRSLAPTLQLLHFQINSLMPDLSPLFDVLSPPTSRSDNPVLFPNLKSFCLDSNFTTFKSLRHFLLSHNNLQHLELNLSTSWDNDKLWGEWLADLVNSNSQFPSLRSLNIYPSTTQTGLSALLTLIKLTASTLSSLAIFRCELNFEEVKQVVNALTGEEVQVQGPTTTTTPSKEPKRLKKLSMDITHLSISFLDLLAGKLPQLEKLALSVVDIVDSDQSPFYDLLHHRRYDPNITCTQDVLHTWKLHHLSIRPYEFMSAVGAVAGAVPTLSRRMRLDMV